MKIQDQQICNYKIHFHLPLLHRTYILLCGHMYSRFQVILEVNNMEMHLFRNRTSCGKKIFSWRGYIFKLRNNIRGHQIGNSGYRMTQGLHTAQAISLHKQSLLQRHFTDSAQTILLHRYFKDIFLETILFISHQLSLQVTSKCEELTLAKLSIL